MLPHGFFGLLQKDESVALVILAHYCVALFRVQQEWWLKDWSSSVLESIWHNIDPTFRHILCWPRKMVNLAMA